MTEVDWAGSIVEMTGTERPLGSIHTSAILDATCTEYHDNGNHINQTLRNKFRVAQKMSQYSGNQLYVILHT